MKHILLAGACLIALANQSQARMSLFNRIVPREAISTDGPYDPFSGGKCLRTIPGWPLSTVSGWLEIIGYVHPGDGFRHTIVGKCLEDGTVLILEDYPYPE